MVRAGAVVGPYARLRPGADIGADAHVGNFVEVKNVTLGRGRQGQPSELSGDGAVGAGTNIGAGTIFCNYDGFDKSRTEIGEGAFIGSNTPAGRASTVGDRASYRTGSVITQDVGPTPGAGARRARRSSPAGPRRFAP